MVYGKYNSPAKDISIIADLASEAKAPCPFLNDIIQLFYYGCDKTIVSKISCPYYFCYFNIV